MTMGMLRTLTTGCVLSKGHDTAVPRKGAITCCAHRAAQ
jgi:hypothetical protein